MEGTSPVIHKIRTYKFEPKPVLPLAPRKVSPNIVTANGRRLL